MKIYKSITQSIYIYLRGDVRKKDGTALICMRITITGEVPHVVNLGLRVDPKFWNAKTGEVGEGCDDAYDINLLIRKAKARANDVFVRYRLMEKNCTISDFKREYTLAMANRESFYEFWELRMDYDYENDVIAKNTWEAQRSTLNKLKLFKPSLSFAELDVDMLIKFDKFVKKENPDIMQNTRWGYFKQIRKYCKLALKQKLISDNPCDAYMVGSVAGEIMPCTQNELRILIAYYHAELIPEHHRNVLQHFLFSCFTSLRISDIHNLTEDNITKGFVTYSPVKLRRRTPKIVKIPLTPMARQFLKQEKTKPFARVYNDDQTINKILRQIRKKTGIETWLSTHVARHTFATVFLERGGTVDVLQQLMGHSNIKDTMRYVKVSTARKESQMKVFDGFLS